MPVSVLRPADLGRWVSCAAAWCAVAISCPGPGRAQSLFEATPLDMQRFVLVAAPIGSKGDRAQLNIYEQLNPKRACFSIGPGKPAAVEPLLASFDFTGICSRYIDANGFSLRIGGTDLATSYRLMVSRSGDDTVLLGLPTKAGAGPELVIARTQGAGGGFLKLELEPGWTLMRRSFRGRQLGHVYVYGADWPGAAAASPVAGPSPSAGATPAPAAPPLLPAVGNPAGSSKPAPTTPGTPTSSGGGRPTSLLTPLPASQPQLQPAASSGPRRS
ncbi:MAG: DUF3747 domain-containing protein [Synechococcaceae cyanobacterium]